MQFGFGNSHVESLKENSPFGDIYMVGGEMKNLGYANIVWFFQNLSKPQNCHIPCKNGGAPLYTM
jgi:hypothetical protein